MMQGLTAKSAGKEAHIDDFEILHTIGEGTFGKVKLVRHILTGTQVAVKVIKKRRQSFSSVQALFREVCSLKALNHPNIVKLVGVIDTEETFFVVMEYLSGGDMYRYLKTHGRMTEAQARGPFQQLVSALQHCHRRGIVHRDLKPLSLLFDSNMNIKLTDFGLSNKCDDIVQLATICGTHPYAAPELFLGQSYSGPAVDVWSLGVVLYTMVTGSRPFVGKDFQELRKQILQGAGWAEKAAHPKEEIFSLPTSRVAAENNEKELEETGTRLQDDDWESQLQLEILRSWVDRTEPENQITEGPARFLTYPVAPCPAEGEVNVVGVRQADLDTGHQLSGLEPRAADLPHHDDDDDDDKTLQMAS
ncbi:serine/threonine-protein kinase MARK2-like [Balaenoptera musculus]|uniref:non-specific serine/threonine protein kinase n=1 Tax=Balaenoptera musculus TaxID=9771 RepID=A0A8B8ZD98_BALMU|nr:serine/threonine-protein kinase MARK2-like [Balaenoptera musculus]